MIVITFAPILKARGLGILYMIQKYQRRGAKYLWPQQASISFDLAKRCQAPHWVVAGKYVDYQTMMVCFRIIH